MSYLEFNLNAYEYVLEGIFESHSIGLEYYKHYILFYLLIVILFRFLYSFKQKAVRLYTFGNI
jgi:uncharacterized membrane protein